jgi:hypothetical protein
MIFTIWKLKFNFFFNFPPTRNKNTSIWSTRTKAMNIWKWLEHIYLDFNRCLLAGKSTTICLALKILAFLEQNMKEKEKCHLSMTPTAYIIIMFPTYNINYHQKKKNTLWNNALITLNLYKTFQSEWTATFLTVWCVRCSVVKVLTLTSLLQLITLKSLTKNTNSCNYSRYDIFL